MAGKFLDQDESISRFCHFTTDSSRILAPIQGYDKQPLVSLQQAVQPLVPLVPQIDQMVWTVEENYHGSKDNLSKDETTSIMLYTLEWTPSESSFYFILNATLRSENRKNLIPWFSYFRLFINAISKLPPNPHQIIYRGVHMDLSNAYPEGKEFIWWSFTSCTSSLNVVQNFIGQDGMRTIFNIVCHSAKDISQHSCHEEEQEVLCYPARKFRVKTCLDAGNQLHIIHLEEIQPKFPFFHIPPTSTFSTEETKRRAIDSSGDLGCLYNINRDCIIAERLNMNGMKRSSQLYRTIHCQIIDTNLDRDENLLEIIGVQDELRLSLLLNLTAKTGLALLNDYTRPIDKYSRLIHYSYLDREERLSNDISKIQEGIRPNIDATHIITSITVGIEFVAVLQLPSNDKLAEKVDHLLQYLQLIFQEDRKFSSLTSDDEYALKTIHDTKIYSNIPQLMEMTSLLDVCQRMDVIKKKDSMLRPLTYTLQPVNSKVRCTLLPSILNNKVEQRLMYLSIRIKHLKYAFDHDVIPLLSGYLQQQQQDVQNQWRKLEKMYENEIEYFRNLIFNIRINQDDISEIDRALNQTNQTIVHDHIRQLMQRIEDLKAKGRFINDLQQQQFRYYNVDECHLERDENEQSLERKLIIDHRYNRLLCSNDTLNSNHQPQFNQLYHQLIRERQNNPQLNLVYADFSYCAFDLQDMIILPSNKLINSMNSSQRTSSSLRSLSSSDEFINILLLGETNVNQLNFIKTFTNYLKFETLEQAESNVSSSSIDPLDQSSSQHYRSYVFHLHCLGEKKLRIIDTQDLNLEQILKYINHLSYLNAVCLLLKSNTTQLNTFFQTYLIPLFDFLNPTARKNLIFCFIEARLNSVNLENTIQLLKTSLNSLSMNDIPLKKENTFCFDTESFRQIDWSTFTIESNRLIDYLHQNLSPCRMQGKHQSFKQAQFEIISLIRPILETMRNILRNMIVQTIDLPEQFIQLNPKPIHRSAARCLSCKPHADQLGVFWIVADTLHEIQEICYSCSCSPEQHILVDYLLEYKLSNHPLDNNQYQMKDMLIKLCHISAEFAFFLMYVVRSTTDDLFCFYLTRMINEENNISLSQQSNHHFNLQLVNDLKRLKNDYEIQFNDLKNNHRYGTLQDIYQWIQTVRQYPMICEQMLAIKQGQEMIMKQCEYEVPGVTQI